MKSKGKGRNQGGALCCGGGCVFMVKVVGAVVVLVVALALTKVGAVTKVTPMTMAVVMLVMAIYILPSFLHLRHFSLLPFFLASVDSCPQGKLGKRTNPPPP